jgi:hypothetical protein
VYAPPHNKALRAQNRDYRQLKESEGDAGSRDSSFSFDDSNNDTVQNHEAIVVDAYTITPPASASSQDKARATFFDQTMDRGLGADCFVTVEKEQAITMTDRLYIYFEAAAHPPQGIVLTKEGAHFLEENDLQLALPRASCQKVEFVPAETGHRLLEANGCPVLTVVEMKAEWTSMQA